MLFNAVPPPALQWLPIFKSCIDCFMPCPHHWHLPIIKIMSSTRCYTVISCINITNISNEKLIVIQYINQRLSNNSQIWECPTWKWPIDPHNPPCLNGNSNFIPNTWSLALVTKPSWPEWLWFTIIDTASITCQTHLQNVFSCTWQIDANISSARYVLVNSSPHNKQWTGCTSCETFINSHNWEHFRGLTPNKDQCRCCATPP